MKHPFTHRPQIHPDGEVFAQTHPSSPQGHDDRLDIDMPVLRTLTGVLRCRLGRKRHREPQRPPPTPVTPKVACPERRVSGTIALGPGLGRPTIWIYNDHRESPLLSLLLPPHRSPGKPSVCAARYVSAPAASKVMGAKSDETGGTPRSGERTDSDVKAVLERLRADEDSDSSVSDA